MIHFFAVATVLVTTPALAVAAAPTVYIGAAAAAAANRLCNSGCTITPQVKIIRAAITPQRQRVAVPARARTPEADARSQLDQLIASLD